VFDNPIAVDPYAEDKFESPIAIALSPDALLDPPKEYPDVVVHPSPTATPLLLVADADLPIATVLSELAVPLIATASCPLATPLIATDRTALDVGR
jgi:hypothetical protein